MDKKERLEQGNHNAGGDKRTKSNLNGS